MKTITVEQFINIIKKNPIDCLHFEMTTHNLEPYGEVVSGRILNTIRDECGIKITYQNIYKQPKEQPDKVFLHSIPHEWEISGIQFSDKLPGDDAVCAVVGSDGKELSSLAVCGVIKHNTNITAFDLSTISKDGKLNSAAPLDEDKNVDIREIIVKRDNMLDIKFHGKALTAISSKEVKTYSGKQEEPDRWTVLALYKTESGKFICSEVGYSNKDGEINRHSGAVCESETEIIEFFGLGWLAKSLYEKARINAVEEIA